MGLEFYQLFDSDGFFVGVFFMKIDDSVVYYD